MKTTNILIVILIIAIIGIFAFKLSQKNNPDISNNGNNSVPEQTSSIAGCYVSRTGKDVYTLNIKQEEGDSISGSLSFQNFEKDSSSGTFNGTYDDGILLGDYAFRSEGMDSVMQVIFKKSGDDFIRGYGDVNADGTSFTDIHNITFDPSSTLNVFKKEPCVND
jgi:hypothetical protein